MKFINLFKMMMFFFFMIGLIKLNKMFFMGSQMIIMLNESFMNVNMMMIFDMYSMSFFLIIVMVLYNVLSFMNIYMMKNKKMKVFFFMTKLFITSMFMLVFSFNLWTMIIGWEGLGMSSFYLIFYYNNFDSWKSSIKTFINNKMGDSMLLISMIYMLMNLNSMMNINFFFMMSMLTKSAQYPFMAWLPMAMAAPTPISAMVHSSTLVTAGLFIMFRNMNNFLMKMNMNVIMNLCLISMFISGMKALMEKDMKKLIALSTLSQISLMFFFLCMNMKFLAFIYMCNHALFKSLMFINMGMMMMKNLSNQMKFNMNNNNFSSINNISFKISCFNLMNLSFFSSFFIKEKMLMMMNENLFSNMKFLIFLINSFLTMNYSLKMIFFFNKKNFKKKTNSMILNKNYNLSFFLMNIFSVMFSKLNIEFNMLNSNLNIFIILIYLIFMLMNYKMYKKFYLMINSLLFLDMIMFMFPLKMIKNNLDMSEMWMEKFSLNFYFLMKNKMLNKTFNMNFNLIMMLLFIIMFI
uniref:NADH:ubiquinone reductase (H(+)-translocating) n=1 Tax=Tetranychus evansi TaxID=178897 RepID=A0A8F2Q7C6_9ACAR|nr:NADH dehydrogenase subunit 5 [Tetranychus evansi]